MRPDGITPSLVVRACDTCGSDFSAFPSAIKRGRRFCGSICARAGQRRAGPPAGPMEPRLWSKVDRESGAPCWLWTGRLNDAGYGLFDTERGPELAHRLVWRVVRGPLSDDLELRHVGCRVRRCVNPEHTTPGTHAENMADMAEDGSKKGELHAMAVLTEDAVREIRRLVANGAQHAPLAERFGVSRQTIGDVVRRKSWDHI